jgi:hypothetical protein
VQHIDPWNVQGGADGKIDYNKLVEQVGWWHATSIPSFHWEMATLKYTLSVVFAAVWLLKAQC